MHSSRGPSKDLRSPLSSFVTRYIICFYHDTLHFSDFVTKNWASVVMTAKDYYLANPAKEHFVLANEFAQFNQTNLKMLLKWQFVNAVIGTTDTDTPIHVKNAHNAVYKLIPTILSFMLFCFIFIKHFGFFDLPFMSGFKFSGPSILAENKYGYTFFIIWSTWNDRGDIHGRGPFRWHSMWFLGA